MYVEGVNFTSFLFMNVYSIYTFIVLIYAKRKKILFMPLVFAPLCWWIDKRGERNLELLYIHVCLICYLLPLVSRASFVSIKSMFISLVSNIMFMHIYVERSRHIFIVYCYAWVKGELLWSLTLIQAYITPRVLSSSKRERLLAQMPFTLVLMMINSYSYCLLIILWYLVSDIWSRY